MQPREGCCDFHSARHHYGDVDKRRRAVGLERSASVPTRHAPRDGKNHRTNCGCSTKCTTMAAPGFSRSKDWSESAGRSGASVIRCFVTTDWGSDSLATGTSVFGRLAGSRSDRSRWRHGSPSGGFGFPGQRFVHLQGADPAATNRRETSACSSRGHRPRKLTPAQEAALEAYVRANSDMTLAAMRSWLETEHVIRVSSGAMWTIIRRLRLTLKKSRSGRASKNGRTWQSGGGSGARRSLTSIPMGLSSSMRPELPQR